MIVSFADNEAERIWQGRPSQKLPADIQDHAFRKLRQLDAAVEDLRNPPGNRLEPLKASGPGK